MAGRGEALPALLNAAAIRTSGTAGCVISFAAEKLEFLGLLASSVWALLRNKLRSVLTILGITIGIAAVMCVVAIGKAGQVRVEQQMQNLGDNFVWIEAGGRA